MAKHPRNDDYDDDDDDDDDDDETSICLSLKSIQWLSTTDKIARRSYCPTGPDSLEGITSSSSRIRDSTSSRSGAQRLASRGTTAMLLLPQQ